MRTAMAMGESGAKHAGVFLLLFGWLFGGGVVEGVEQAEGGAASS